MRCLHSTDVLDGLCLCTNLVHCRLKLFSKGIPCIDTRSQDCVGATNTIFFFLPLVRTQLITSLYTLASVLAAWKMSHILGKTPPTLEPLTDISLQSFKFSANFCLIPTRKFELIFKTLFVLFNISFHVHFKGFTFSMSTGKEFQICAAEYLNVILSCSVLGFERGNLPCVLRYVGG